MQDVNVSNDLRQLSLGYVKAFKCSRYDINGYRFQMAKLEASHPLVATTNRGLEVSHPLVAITDYYDILQNIVEYTFGGAKELKVVRLPRDWTLA
jgi:hypothetical protein